MIGIRITGYCRHTAGPLRKYQFHVSGLVSVTGQEDLFAHGLSQARAILLGLQALDPLSDFSIREINTDAPGAGTQIDGEDLSLVAMRMERLIGAGKTDDGEDA